MGEELRQGLGAAWSMVATFVPKLLAFLVILFIGWLIAKAVAKGLSMLMGKLGFGRLMERTGMHNLTRNSGIDPGNIIVKLVYYFILLIALQLAFGVFGQSNPVSQLLNEVIAFLPRILVAIVLVIVAAAVGRVVRDLVTSALGNRPYARAIGTGTYVFILALGIIAALNQINIATTVTMPVLITVLATVGAIAAIGLGGGLVKPMQERWGGWLERAQAQMGGGAPQPRSEHAPGAGTAQTAVRQGAAPTGGTSAADAPTPPSGFEQRPR
ncbi:mechanosensitive ion channel family protein [Actinokineospora sp. NPDC004072]